MWTGWHMLSLLWQPDAQVERLDGATTEVLGDADIYSQGNLILLRNGQ